MIWLAIFAVQGVQLARCLIEVGPTQTVWLAMESSVGWSMVATAVVGVIAVIWFVGWPEGRGADPDDPGPQLPPPPA